jgi:micrococcal nuclease
MPGRFPLAPNSLAVSLCPMSSAAMFIRILCFPFALIAFVVSSPTPEFSGKVIAIADGDTITVLRDRSPVKIRLHGIDCPESGQDFGSRAKSFTSEIAFGRVVTDRPIGTDRYHRTVADVVLPDGRLLNHEVVRAGCAWWYRKYAPRDATLERLEREARESVRGLWSQTGAIAPWEWRHPKPAAPAAAESTVIANRRALVYHRLRCPNAARISPTNRITFGSPAAAQADGYRPGKDCHSPRD